MRPPGFWSAPPTHPGWQPRALAPLAALTAAATRRRVARAPDYRAPVPVICIGNVHLGGTGKTPAVIALAGRLADRGIAVQVVTRGHGGRLAGPVRVDERRHSAADTGDEPLLLSSFAPVWVARDRAAGARAAVASGAQAILLDDGFQNPGVFKDAAVLTVNAAEGFGNGRVAPAGPLREPVAAAMARADLVLAVGEAAAQRDFARDRAAGARAAVADGAQAILLDDGFQNPSVFKDAAVLTVNAAEGFGNGRVAPAGPLREPVAAAMARADMVLAVGDGPAQALFSAKWPVPLPVVKAALRPLETGMDWQGMPVFAFAGIGRPSKFFATLETLGAEVRGRVALDDHQPLGEALLNRIAAEAAGLGAQLVTTEKDAVRLPEGWRAKVLTLPVRLEPQDWAPLDALFSRLGL
jgi:tetraacyldisaccharide-1-P 4'-kinase